MEMDVRVVLEDMEGPGVLKCRLEETTDPNGFMSVIKAAKFRVEMQRFFDDSTMSENASLLIVHEKGSVESFKEVCKRLRREWDMDHLDALHNPRHAIDTVAHTL